MEVIRIVWWNTWLNHDKMVKKIRLRKKSKKNHEYSWIFSKNLEKSWKILKNLERNLENTWRHLKTLEHTWKQLKTIEKHITLHEFIYHARACYKNV